MKRIIFIISLLALAAACKKKAPEPVPVPKTPAETSAPVEPAKTDVSGTPAGYFKSLANDPGTAKTQSASFQKTANEQSKTLDDLNAAGN